MTLLHELGRYGPTILLFMSFYLLWKFQNLLFYFTIGFFCNIILNLILKGIFQLPRPTFDNNNFYLIKTYAKPFFFQDGIPFNLFGMPSGHAQMSFFMTIFIYLSLRDKKLLYFYLIFSLFICYQRIISGSHNLFQVFVGSIVGVLFGYFVYQLARSNIRGRIREKPDDYGPI